MFEEIIRSHLVTSREDEEVYCWVDDWGNFHSSFMCEDAPRHATSVIRSSDLERDVQEVYHTLTQRMVDAVLRDLKGK